MTRDLRPSSAEVKVFSSYCPPRLGDSVRACKLHHLVDFTGAISVLLTVMTTQVAFLALNMGQHRKSCKQIFNILLTLHHAKFGLSNQPHTEMWTQQIHILLHVSVLLECHHLCVLISVTVVSFKLVNNMCHSHSLVQPLYNTVTHQHNHSLTRSITSTVTH